MTAPPPPKRPYGGRPTRTGAPARTGHASTKKITVRLTDEERARIEDEAAAHETTPGALMRERGLRREDPS